jgi:general secretion pathway protein K
MLSSRADALVLRNSISTAKAAAAADSAVQRAIFELLRPANLPDAWKADGAVRDWAFDEATVKVSLRDESAKIDINTASDALLKGLFASIGLGDEESTRLLDAIVDWRDADALKRPNGAEEADYKAAGLSYRPANANFQALEELQLVLGLRPEIYRRITPMITVYSRQTGINAATASRDVLLAIPGVTSDVVDVYLQQRDAALAAAQPLPAFPQAGAFASPPNAQVLNIRAEARLEDGTVFVRESVAIPRGAQRRPITFLAWREGSAPEMAAEPTDAAKVPR